MTRNVKSVMRMGVETVDPDATAQTVANRLREPGVESLVVVERASIVGVVTGADVVALVGEGGDLDAAVWTFMASPVVTVSPDERLSDAASLMREAGVRRLPVVEGGAPVGMVTTAELSRHLPDHHLDVRWKGVPLGQRRKAFPFAD